MTQHAIAYSTQSYTSHQDQPEYVTQVSPNPTWEAYYNYAQQLYAAGHQREAEAYYRQAQLLFKQAEKQLNSQRSAANSADSYSPPQSSYTSTNNPSVYAVDYSLTEDIDSFTIKRPKYLSKKRTKTWVVTSLVVALLVSISGFVGLFFFYKSHLRQGTTDRVSDGSILGRVQDMTIFPMIDVLQPTFDKIIRLTLAVQPLLYELSMRDALPEAYYLEALNTGKTSTMGTPSDVGEAKLASMLDVGGTNSVTGADIPAAQAEEKPTTTPATATDESDGQPDSVERAEAAPDETASEDIEDQDDAEAAEDTVASRATSRRSDRRRSARSRRRNRTANVSNSIQEIEPTAPAPSGNASTFNSEPTFEEAEPPPPPPPPLPKTPSKTKELDALLAPKVEPPRSAKNSADKSASLKESLSRTDVQQGMVRVAPAVKQCGQGKGGTISISVVIGQNGRVTSAIANGIYARTPVGACAVRAVRRAVFPACQQSLNVKYPFSL